MTPLERSLRSRIYQHGPISVAEYMAAVSCDPEHGYYRTRDPFGERGDFITAPEICQIFGELLGLWSVVTWRQMGAPNPVIFAELGPGRGTLMADALRAAQADPTFMAAIDVRLVETSEMLRAQQRRALCDVRIRWHDQLDDLPAGPMLLLANEFFDALAIEQYVRTADGWQRRYVGLDRASGLLCFVKPNRPVDWESHIPLAIRSAAVGDVFETCPTARTLIRNLTRRLADDGGAALIIDYGHGATATGETMQAMSRHRYHNVLDTPGIADLTAHVDFQALAGAATGESVHGPIPQGVFLKRLGAQARADRLVKSANPAQRASICSGYRRLTDPDEMGSLFKAIAITHPALGPPAGFEPTEPTYL